MTQCLSDAEILDLVRGSLPEPARTTAAAHLRECRDCAARVERVRESSAPGMTVHKAPTQYEVTSAMEISGNSTGSESHWTDNNLPRGASGEGAPSASISLDQFLSGLSQSGLLPPSELASVRQKSSEDPSTSTVAGLVEWLVKQNKLTPYQAELLARGGKDGLVLGNYVILEKIGQGGMGSVFKARHRRMNRLVALKVLPQSLSSIPEAILRFQREVEAAARLQHPNIASAFDADEASGVHFLVMEHVDGPNLASYVKQRGALPLATAVRLTIHAASGLGAAHQQGIVHRDIKPGNMMVNKQGVLKVLDMGLAQMRGQESNLDLTSDVTQTGRVMGTVDYMAPEQARDAKNVDLRADIYSLGCTLYFFATGKAPAPGGSAAEKLLWHQTQNVPPLSSEIKESTPRLDAALAKMMAKKAEDRFATMPEVAAELEQCLAELPAADASGLMDGLDLVGEHGATTIGGSRYGQQTMAGSIGDTIMTEVGRRSVSMLPPSEQRNSRALLYAGGVGIALTLALLVAVPWLWRSTTTNAAGLGDATLAVIVEGGPANVLVNGEARGQAGVVAGEPLKLSVKSGKLLVQVQREGFESFQQEFDIEAGQPVQVAAALKKLDRLPTSATAPSPHLPYEKLLGWVFSHKGQVTANIGGGEQLHLTDLAQLPKQPIDILGIKLDSTGVRDADLSLLAVAPGLRELSLADTRITDQGLEQLLALKALKHLNLSKTGVTNGGMEKLNRLSDLSELNLEKTQLTNPGLLKLLTLSKLERLYLSDTGVTDVGIDQLRSLKSLKLLTLHGTSLGDAQHAVLKKALPELDIAWDGADVERGVALKLLDKGATIAVVDRTGQRHDGLKNIESLPPGRVSVKDVNLTSGANFADEDLKQMAGLSDIEGIALSGSKVSQNGLEHLQGLTTLRRVDLGTLRLPPTAVESLRKALPACQVIVREPADVEVARSVIGFGGGVSVFTERNQLLRDLKAMEQLPAGQYALRAINLDDVSGIEDGALAKIGELPFLESLFLTNTGVTDKGLERIAACKSLQELSLSGTKITAAGISALAPLPKLARLYVANTTLGSEGIRQIGELTGLTHLSVLGVALTNDDLAPLKRLDKLEWLDVSGTALADPALSHLVHFTKLRELHVTGTRLSDAAREELSVSLGQACRIVGDPPDAQRLAARWIVDRAGTVVLENGKLTSSKSLPRTACHVLTVDLADLDKLKRDDIKTHLAACKDIVALNLSGTSLAEADLAFLNSMPSLRELRLARLPLTDKALELLAGHPGLEVLDLSGTYVTGQGLQHLAAAAGLKQLILANARVSDVHFASLTQFPQLELLDVSATSGIGDAGLETIAKLPSLKTVRVRGAKITDAALEKLAALTDLEELDIESAKVTDDGVAKLSPLTKLRVINLGNTQVTDGVTATLAKMTQLKSVNLARTKITAESIKQLQTELKGCSIIAPALAPRDANAGTGVGGPGVRGPFNFGNQP